MRDQIYSVGDLRAIIAPIAARHGADRIYLFGSYARGEAAKTAMSICVSTRALGAVCLRWARSIAISKTALERIWIC